MSPTRSRGSVMRSILAASLVALMFTGCGGGGESPDQRAAVRTLESWLGAMASGNNRVACEWLTPHLQNLIDEQLRMHSVHGTCHTWAARWTSPFRAPGHRRAEVKSVRISGTTATAILWAPPDIQSEATLQKVRERWKVENY